MCVKSVLYCQFTTTTTSMVKASVVHIVLGTREKADTGAENTGV